MWSGGPLRSPKSTRNYHAQSVNAFGFEALVKQSSEAILINASLSLADYLRPRGPRPGCQCQRSHSNARPDLCSVYSASCTALSLSSIAERKRSCTSHAESRRTFLVSRLIRGAARAPTNTPSSPRSSPAQPISDGFKGRVSCWPIISMIRHPGALHWLRHGSPVKPALTSHTMASDTSPSFTA